MGGFAANKRLACLGLWQRHLQSSESELQRCLAGLLLGEELAEKTYGPLIEEDWLSLLIEILLQSILQKWCFFLAITISFLPKIAELSDSLCFFFALSANLCFQAARKQPFFDPKITHFPPIYVSSHCQVMSKVTFFVT